MLGKDMRCESIGSYESRRGTIANLIRNRIEIIIIIDLLTCGCPK